MKFRIGHVADAASYLGLSSEEDLHFPGCIESIKHRDRDSMFDPPRAAYFSTLRKWVYHMM
jgi:hypothetical protein